MKSIQTILLCLAVVLFKPLDAFTVRPQRTVSSLHAPSSNTNNFYFKKFIFRKQWLQDFIQWKDARPQQLFDGNRYQRYHYF